MKKKKLMIFVAAAAACMTFFTGCDNPILGSKTTASETAKKETPSIEETQEEKKEEEVEKKEEEVEKINYNYDNGCIKLSYNEKEWDVHEEEYEKSKLLTFFEKGKDVSVKDDIPQMKEVSIMYDFELDKSIEEIAEAFEKKYEDAGYTVKKTGVTTNESVNQVAVSKYYYSIDDGTDVILARKKDEDTDCLIQAWSQDGTFDEEEKMIDSLVQYAPASEAVLPDDDIPSDDETTTDDSSGLTRGTDEYENMSKVILNSNGFKISIPIINSDDTLVTDTIASGHIHGITTYAELLNNYAEDPNYLQNQMKDNVNSYVDSMKNLDFYQDVMVEDIITGVDVDGCNYAIQQVDYNYVDYDGNKLSCLKIFKITQLNESYYVSTDVECDGSMTDGYTRPIFDEACKAYGIEFQYE